jgi:sulfur carrier protein
VTAPDGSRTKRRVVTGTSPSTASSVHVTVNGAPLELAGGTSVAQLVAETCHSDRGVAVALDREVVPRSSWPTVIILEGASVEIVTAAAGG